MSARVLKALVLTGDGINCETETAHALKISGFQPEIRHLNDLISARLNSDELSAQYSLLALPGGFSFGDDLTSGKVLALKISHGLGWDLPAFANRGGLVIGICNGFQTLVRMGLFGKDISITSNQNGKFIDTWVKTTPIGTKCIWLKGVGTMDLPIRHGEGRIIFKANTKTEVLGKMERFGMTCLKYEENITGSEEKLAGLCDSTGRIFGLMPHPEAFVRWTAHPEWTSQAGRAGGPGQGLVLFENAYQEAMRALG